MMSLSLSTVSLVNRFLPMGGQPKSGGDRPDGATHPSEGSSAEPPPLLSPDRGDLVQQALGRRGLFVIGHARTGTTVLANALNDSEHVLILNEADLYGDPGTPDFRARHNGLHRRLQNQENKGNFCPKLFDGDRGWDAYLIALAAHYRYVGAKMVITPQSPPDTIERVLGFATRYFYGSHFLFTFRHPADVFGSNLGLAAWSGAEGAAFRTVAGSILKVMRLYIHMIRTMPHVAAVFHESVGSETFTRLGERLGLDLAGSAAYYESGRARTYPDSIPAGDDQNLADHLLNIHCRLSALSESGSLRAQLDQNSAHLDARHFTPLGRLAQEIDYILASLAGQT